MKSSYLLVNGLRYHYLYDNLEGRQGAVVMLHGLGSSAQQWEQAAPVLVRARLALYAPDFRGHGLTDPPEAAYDFQTLVGDLTAFMDACTIERPILVGHGMGALLAVDYAARYTVGPRAPSALVLVDGNLDKPEGAPEEDGEEKRIPTPLPVEDFTADVLGRFDRVRCPIMAVFVRSSQAQLVGKTVPQGLLERGVIQAGRGLARLDVHILSDAQNGSGMTRSEEISRLIIKFMGGINR